MMPEQTDNALGDLRSELEDLPRIPVDQKPELLVLANGPEVAAWAVVFPDGSAWLINANARTIIHSGSVKTLVNFWGGIFQCDVGIPEETP